MDQDGWHRLADEVRRRRESLGLAQHDLEDRGGPGPWTVRNIEQSKRTAYSRRTYTSLERALQWRQGIVEKILEGTAKRGEIDEVVPLNAHDRSGGAAAAATGGGQRGVSGTGTLGFTAEANGHAHPPVEDRGVGTDSVSVERLEQLRFGPGERIPPRDATIVTVAELLARLRAEKERTPSMDDAEAALLKLLPELYGRDFQRDDPAPDLPEGRYTWPADAAPSNRRRRDDEAGHDTGS